MPEFHPIRLMIVDRQAEARELAAAIGRGLQFDCVEAESAEQLFTAAGREAPDLVLLELADEWTLELPAEVKRRWPCAEMAAMSCSASIDLAVAAMRLGAYDYLVKPLLAERLTSTLQGMAARVREAQTAAAAKRDEGAGSSSAGAPPCLHLEELERATVQKVFEMVGGDKVRAQELLGISRATLYRKIKRYGIQAAKPGQVVPAEVVREGGGRVILLSQS